MAASTDGSFDHLFTFARGDLDIKVTYKGQQVKGKVVSHAISMASPVWNKFHTPPWKNSDDPAVTEIDFSEDDGAALLILLRIVHLQLNEIPATIDLMTFYNIAVLCEQYDCLHLISPWVKKWSEELKSADTTGVKFAKARRLFIYWATGNIPDFRNLSTSCVHSSKITTHEGVSRSSLARYILPEGLYESIKAARNLTIERLLDIPYKEVDRYLQAYLAEGGPRLCKEEDFDCDVYTYGSLTLELTKMGVWPRKHFGDIKSSVRSLAELLHDFSPNFLGELGKHDNCGGGNYAIQVNQIWNEVPDPTLECHLRHMEDRNKITKVSGDSETSNHPQCARCSTCHSTVQECPPNPRKRPAE